MSALPSAKVYLAMRCGNRCAMPACRIELTQEGKKAKNAIIGEAAHIHGEKDGAARYVASMTDKQRNEESNLIYLCPNCHTKIDKQEADYPAATLLKIKCEHIAWIKSLIDAGLAQVGFAELEVAANALSSGQHSVSGSFEVITPESKIQKNNLSGEIRGLIAMGLSRGHEVSEFLSKMAEVDANFPDRLTNGFKAKYSELATQLNGDELFYALLNYAETGQPDVKRRAAALAIQCHLFHICEVFEK